MDVDQPRRDQLARSRNDGVDGAGKARAYVEDSVIFVDQDAIAQNCVMAVLKAYDPATLNQRASHCRRQLCQCR